MDAAGGRRAQPRMQAAQGTRPPAAAPMRMTFTIKAPHPWRQLTLVAAASRAQLLGYQVADPQVYLAFAAERLRQVTIVIAELV